MFKKLSRNVGILNQKAKCVAFINGFPAHLQDMEAMVIDQTRGRISMYGLGQTHTSWGSRSAGAGVRLCLFL